MKAEKIMFLLNFLWFWLVLFGQNQNQRKENYAFPSFTDDDNEHIDNEYDGDDDGDNDDGDGDNDDGGGDDARGGGQARWCEEIGMHRGNHISSSLKLVKLIFLNWWKPYFFISQSLKLLKTIFPNLWKPRGS